MKNTEQILRSLLLFTFLWLTHADVQAQKDSVLVPGASDEELDALFSDLEKMLDSLTESKSFSTVSLTAGNRLLNVQTSTGKAATTQSLMVSAAAAYYHKSGIGLAGGAALLAHEGNLRPSQYLATVSYDYLRLPVLLTGIAYARFHRPDSLGYYTSPLKNELSAYAMYRKSWLKPSVSVTYGWGTREEVRQQQLLVKVLREKKKRRRSGGTITVPITEVVTTSESVSDWMISFSARHDWYFFNVLSSRDNIRITPQFAINGGTQKYGFNQSTNTYLVKRSDALNKPYLSDQMALQNATKFQPLSVIALLRTAYTKGKFFLQPQVIFDYYLPATTDNLSTSFALNTGLIF